MKKKAEERLLIKQEGKCKGTKAIYKEIVQKKKEIEEEKNIGKEAVKLLVEQIHYVAMGRSIDSMQRMEKRKKHANCSI